MPSLGVERRVVREEGVDDFLDFFDGPEDSDEGIDVLRVSGGEGVFFAIFFFPFLAPV